MAYAQAFVAQEPSRAEVDAMPGDVVLEFGAPWCGHCIAAAPLAEQALAAREVRHLRIEDGRGRPLGRSFRVKLWPTFVLMRDGVEVGRTVRPRSMREIEVLFDTDDDWTEPQDAMP
jgi:thioredoxin 1